MSDYGKTEKEERKRPKKIKLALKEEETKNLRAFVNNVLVNNLWFFENICIFKKVISGRVS